MAGLPLTLQRLIAGQSSDTSTWEMRHELSYVRLLLRFPFTMAALLLGGALWWVTRRLFGNAGGFVALAFYCVSPAIVAAGSQPNAEITTALGIFATIYTAIGVAHAMQGPRRKWRPRIVLLAAGLALVAASHSAALLLTLPLALVFMVYLAERNRTAVPMVMVAGTLGAFLLLFACYAFHPDALTLLLPFRRGPPRHQYGRGTRASLLIRERGHRDCAGGRAVLYMVTRRSRYFGNTVPLLIALCFLPLVTTGVFGQPWLWALPFLHDLCRRRLCRRAGDAPRPDLPLGRDGDGGAAGSADVSRCLHCRKPALTQMGKRPLVERRQQFCAFCAGVCITSANAVWKACISCAVPTVMRTCVGHTGHTRPMYTFFACMAAITCFASRRVSSMKQLFCDFV